MARKQCRKGKHQFTYTKPRKNEYGEWVIKAYRDGKRYENADYFAGDKQDAEDTARALTGCFT